MGDFNAKIGSDSSNTGYNEVMGGHGFGEMNENWERFEDTCALNNMAIGGSLFPHKRIHNKATWVSPDLKQRNRLTRSVLQRSSEYHYKTSVSREHHLVAAKLKLS